MSPGHERETSQGVAAILVFIARREISVYRRTRCVITENPASRRVTTRGDIVCCDSPWLHLFLPEKPAKDRQARQTGNIRSESTQGTNKSVQLCAMKLATSKTTVSIDIGYRCVGCIWKRFRYSRGMHLTIEVAFIFNQRISRKLG